MIDHDCRVCGHPYLARHVETERWVATDQERRTRRCRDCVDCHPPEDAPVREDVREEVPA